VRRRHVERLLGVRDLPVEGLEGRERADCDRRVLAGDRLDRWAAAPLHDRAVQLAVASEEGTGSPSRRPLLE
jgi:hypothetical protein